MLLSLCLSLAVLAQGMFFVTLHDKPNNVLTYDSNFKFKGNLISNSASLDELRGMAVFQDYMFVANSHDTDSKIVRVPKCGGQATDFITAGLDHPYDIAVDSTAGLLYAANQDTGNVNVYNARTGALMNLFANVSNPRGVEVDQKGNVFVASEGFNAVLAFSNQGRLLWSLPFDNPIGLAIGALNDKTEVLLVGSNSDSASSFYASFNLTSFQTSGSLPPRLQTYSDKKLLHPAGVVLQNDTIYGFDQTHQSLLTWQAKSGKFLDSVLDVSGPPEQLDYEECD